MASDQTIELPRQGVLGRIVRPELVLIAATLLWGGNFVAGKELASDVDPITISFWRWTLALLILLPFSLGALRQHRRLLVANWRLVTATGATGIAGYSLFLYAALSSTTAINALLFISTAPLLITLASRWARRDHGTTWQLIGTLVSSAGAVIVIAHGDISRLVGLHLNRGDIWMLAGVLAWVVYSVLLRERPLNLPSLPFFTASAIAGVLMMAPMVGWQLARGERLELTVPTVAGLLYVAVGVSAMGYACWTRAVSSLGSERAGAFLHLVPVFGTLMAAIFLNERLAPYHLVGAALVGGGLWVASVRRARGTRVARAPGQAHPRPQA